MTEYRVVCETTQRNEVATVIASSFKNAERIKNITIATAVVPLKYARIESREVSDWTVVEDSHD